MFLKLIQIKRPWLGPTVLVVFAAAAKEKNIYHFSFRRLQVWTSSHQWDRVLMPVRNTFSSNRPTEQIRSRSRDGQASVFLAWMQSAFLRGPCPFYGADWCSRVESLKQGWFFLKIPCEVTAAAETTTTTAVGGREYFFWQKKIKNLRQQKQKYWCCYPHWSRDSVSPVCGIFFIRRLRNMDEFSSRRQSCDGRQEHIFFIRSLQVMDLFRVPNKETEFWYINERPGSDHVIVGPLRCLEKNCMGRG